MLPLCLSHHPKVHPMTAMSGTNREFRSTVHKASLQSCPPSVSFQGTAEVPHQLLCIHGSLGGRHKDASERPRARMQMDAACWYWILHDYIYRYIYIYTIYAYIYLLKLYIYRYMCVCVCVRYICFMLVTSLHRH